MAGPATAPPATTMTARRASAGSATQRSWARWASLGARIPGWVGGAAGVIAVLVLWQVIASAVNATVVPPPSTIISQMRSDGWSFYWSNAETTMWEAARGWFWGNLLAVGFAMLFLVAPVVERPLLQLGIVSYCLPLVAIGPILAIVFTGDTPKVILSALAVFFTTLIGTLLGLRSADATGLDMVEAFGGGRWHKLVKVRLHAALPSMFAGLRIATPSAMLGAIVGEYIGGNRGLGIAMIDATQTSDLARLWGIAVVSTAIAGIAYGIVSVVERALTPWARAAR
jgi:ABC-type nitrate/sulfonate/bicarbonate transport system permease component